MTNYLLLLLIAFGPLICTLCAALVAILFGINLNEGSPPHIWLIGDVLYAMGNMFWLSFVTAPLAAVIAFFYTIKLIYSHYRN